MYIMRSVTYYKGEWMLLSCGFVADSSPFFFGGYVYKSIRLPACDASTIYYQFG